MVQILPADNNGWNDVFKNLGLGATEGYANRADEMALQNAIGGLAPNATPRQILDAVTKTKTYSPEAKQNLFKNYLGASEFEEVQRHAKAVESQNKLEAEEKRAERESKVKETQEKRNQEIASTKELLNQTGKYTPEEVEKLSKKLTPVDARTIAKPQEPVYEKESDKLAAKRVDSYISDVEDQGKAAARDIGTLDLMENLGDEGATGFKVQNALADWATEKGIPGAEALRDPLSKAFNTVSKGLFANITKYVGGKVSNFEFGVFKGMIAQAEDSPQAAKAMVVAQKLPKQIQVAEDDVMQQVLNEYREKGESIPTNINNIVQKRLKPIADQLTREASDKILNIVKPRTKVQNYELNEKLWNESLKK
jgi:hypothetical protein